MEEKKRMKKRRKMKKKVKVAATEGRRAPPDTLTRLNGLTMADVRSASTANVTFAS